MVSEVTPGAGQAVSLGLAAPVGDPQAAKASSQADVVVPQTHSDATSVQVKERLWADLATQHESRLRGAQQTRENLKVAKAGLGAIKTHFEDIVKWYPPYPLDNPQRVALLNKVNGLRQQVEKLEFPPPKDTDGPSSPGNLKLGFGEINPAKTSNADIARYYQGVQRAQEQLATVAGAGTSSVGEQQALIGSQEAQAHFAAAPNTPIGVKQELLSALV